MARQHTRTLGPADAMGLLIGHAISEGLLQGLRGAVSEVRADLEPFHSEVLNALRRELEEQISAAKAEAEELASLTRPCAEEICDRQAVARGLCRRHYARLTYKERRERQGASVTPRANDRLPPGGGKVKKKNVAAIAPIVRRKKDTYEIEVAGKAPPREAEEAKPEVTAESVARFFGIGK